jgi:hypothetical protein
VLEYVKFTNRHALVQEFVPAAEEQRLYNLVSDYLQRPTLHALPGGQRQLMTLILRKLLASSTFAISGTLDGLAQRLDEAAKAAEAVDALPEGLPEDVEDLDELADEWEGDEGDAPQSDKARLTPEQLAEMRDEKPAREFAALAKSIVKNSKAKSCSPPAIGFGAAAEAGEATRLQRSSEGDHLHGVAQTQGTYLAYRADQFAGKVMPSTAPTPTGSRRDHRRWPNAMRAPIM